ncbi:unnamed protein product [Cladocopium goreaui]|uniref:Methyltransferase C26A3.06 n=1 Tax=Cladocopium goreaui TaxID=2562237 RepID=A0A9P1BUU0_9DINO|nr:unnamed protein product [Cladocopium goreaui]
MNVGDIPRPVTGLMSQTARHVMRKDSSLPELKERRGAGAMASTGGLRPRRSGGIGSSSEGALRKPTGRPSTVARRENSRRDFINEQLQQLHRQADVLKAVGGHRSSLLNSGLSRRDSIDTLAETFGRDMRGVTDRLDDIVRNLRFEDLKSKHEKEERKRREEELLQEEKRKATRKKEQAASDPRKKVAIRIETFRQNFPVDSPDFPGNAIPMCSVQVEGPLGPETVSLVDVEGLRSRCLISGPTPNIDDLLDRQRRTAAKLRGTASPRADRSVDLLSLTPRSPGVRSCTSTMSFGLNSQTFSALTWDDRRRQANAMRQASKVEDVLRKLCSMRCLPTDMQIDFASLQACLDYEKHKGPMNDIESLQSVVAVKLNGFIDNLANKLALDPDSGNTALLKSLGKLSVSTMGEQLNMSQHIQGPVGVGLMPSPQSSLSLEDGFRSHSTLRARTRRAMALLRATSRWVMVLRGVRRRDYNIAVIKAGPRGWTKGGTALGWDFL